MKLEYSCSTTAVFSTKVASKTQLCRYLIAPVLALALLAACTSPEEKEAQHLARGIELFEANDDAKAMVEFRNVLRLDPKNGDALYHVGLIHQRAGRTPQALTAFRQATLERPEFVSAWVRLGTLAFRAGDVETAAPAAVSSWRRGWC